MIQDVINLIYILRKSVFNEADKLMFNVRGDLRHQIYWAHCKCQPECPIVSEHIRIIWEKTSLD